VVLADLLGERPHPLDEFQQSGALLAHQRLAEHLAEAADVAAECSVVGESVGADGLVVHGAGA